MMEGCKEHSQQGNAGGYATCWWQGQYTGMHRKVYCETAGVSLQDIKGLVVRHRCDNPRCIAPDHLEIGTHKDNAQDMVQRGRHVSGWARADYKQTSNRRRGEANPQSTWTVLQVLECRALWGTGQWKQTELAALYGCRQTDISRIVNRKAWVHV